MFCFKALWTSLVFSYTSFLVDRFLRALRERRTVEASYLIQGSLAVLRQFAVCSRRIDLHLLCPNRCCFDVDKTFDIVLVTVKERNKR